jgi:thiopeptide-type bacteriocin biosynthesis protein
MKNYRFNNKFVLRTPTKTIKTTFNKEEIVEFFTIPQNQEALYLASRDLYLELKKYLNQELRDNSKAKFILSLSKYYFRMHSRATPFGLFASCTVGEFDNENDLTVDVDNTGYRYTRLDMSIIFVLLKKMEGFDSIKKQLIFKPSSSLYELNGEFRFAECKYLNLRRSFQLTAIEADEYVERTLNFAKEGQTIEALANNLVDEEIDFDSAEEFVQDLINSQLLISNIEISITGQSPFKKILEFLESHPSLDDKAQEFYQCLVSIYKGVKKLDEGANAVEDYEDIIEQIQALEIPFNRRQVFQVDYYNTPRQDLKIEKTVLSDIKKCFIFLNQISGAMNRTNPDLQKFSSELYSKYESREIPLSTALDNEFGFGYPADKKSLKEEALVRKLKIPRRRSNIVNLPWEKNSKILFQAVLEAIKDGRDAINLDQVDFDLSEPVSLDPYPDTMSFSFSLFEDVEKNQLIHLYGIGSFTATALLGRFTYGHEKIHELVKEIVAVEERNNADKIVAEIVHLPENFRLGNVLIHPPFRKYEIPYLSNSGVADEDTIHISDLMVQALPNKRIRLTSKSKKKEVLTRLSNAHSYRNSSLPFYRFLSDMQGQNTIQGIRLNTYGYDKLFKYTPRILWKNIVLQRAKWTFEKADFEPLWEKGKEMSAKMENFKSQWSIPNTIVLIEGDNELLINLDNPLSLKIFLSTIKKKDKVIFEEYIFSDSDSSPVKNNEGHGYVNQIIASAFKPSDASLQTQKSTKQKQTVEVTREFLPGSEWVYFKIYCEIKRADKLLLNDIYPLVQNLYEKEQLEKWFFLRYSDPEFHIRVRFKINSQEHLPSILQKINVVFTPKITSGEIKNVQIDTYKRELKRYGKSTMEISESLFSINSDTVLKHLKNFYETEKVDRFKWLFGIILIDDFLTAFGFSIDRKLNLMSWMKDNFNREFNMDKGLKGSLEDQFKRYKKDINRALNSAEEHLSELELQIIKEHTERLIPFAKKIKAIRDEGSLDVGFMSFFDSHIHMCLNRIFMSFARMQEMVIYNFLYRHYKTEQSKLKYLQKKTKA